ncbi:hypothetical protein LTR84_009029 [Exophiala bonariae]|uniref:Transcription factor domain-containing protein n=1 Tax=Exophiala bonariae TaxID=1690606 RepID=A0AAV9MVJ9_9EURO|nr:hypothetical protein LTR84_009029 [Exophiala bonariae]
MSTRLIRLEALIDSSSSTHQVRTYGGQGRRTTTDGTAIHRTNFHAAEVPKDGRSAIAMHEVDSVTMPDSILGRSDFDSVLEHPGPRSVAATNFESEGSRFEPSHDQIPSVIIDAAYFQSESTTTTTTTLNPPSVTMTGSTPALEESSNLFSNEMSNRAYFGPRSFLSIASQPGIEWLESKVQYPAMRESLHRFARTVNMLFKENAGSVLAAKCPTAEPAEAVAWSYVRAFFEVSLEAAIGIIDHYWFYTTLTEHFRRPRPDDEDPSWFALRYTVYAFGCRISKSKNEPYSHAAEKSVALFENALSVQLDIMHRRSTIISVRALSLMAIDDDEISCDAPKLSTSISDISTPFTTISVLLSQIQSQAYRRLSSARARRQPTEKLVRAVSELNTDVDSFKRSVKHIIPFDDAIEDVQLPPNMTRCQLMVVYFLYYSVLTDIHSSLLVPWFSFTDSGQFDAFRAQVESSCRIVAETARNVILCSRLIRLKPNTPVLLALYAPFRASIMLLIHILSNPGAPTAQSDLVLMSIGSGFAHRLNFETGGAFNWPFIEEWAASASAAVHRARPSDAILTAQIREPSTTAVDSSGADVGAEGESNTVNLDENQYFQEVCPIRNSYNFQLLQPMRMCLIGQG